MSAEWESTRRILNRFVAQCELVRLAPTWDRLRCRRQTLCVLSDAERVVASLREEWDEADLIQSGLLRRRNGEVAIARRLINNGPLMVLRAGQRHCPYEIVGGRGNLTYRGLPLLDSLGDYQIRKHLTASQRSLFVTTEIWDAVILRALGLPATERRTGKLIPICRRSRCARAPNKCRSRCCTNTGANILLRVTVWYPRAIHSNRACRAVLVADQMQ